MSAPYSRYTVITLSIGPISVVVYRNKATKEVGASAMTSVRRGTIIGKDSKQFTINYVTRVS